MSDLLAFLSWYGVITLVGIVSFPIAFRLFPRLSSRGYALIRPLSLLIWGFSFWLLCSLGVLQNDLGGVISGLIILVLISVVLTRTEKWNELWTWVRSNWRFILTAEIVFIVLFAFWTIIRAANPDAAYTEKPMELAFINSILKSKTFPPQDPWLSGYAISYYYFGYVIVSMLIRMTGVISSVGFNLSSSLWFAMTGAAAFGIIHDLLSAWKSSKSSQENGQLLTSPSSGFARVGGLLGPFFLLLLGNLEGLLEILYARRAFWKVGANGTLTSGFWTWLGIPELNVAPTQPISWLPNRTNGWLWWRGSRVIQDFGISGGNIEIIDEFPFFTYLISDLHPHLLAMPFCFLALALALNLFLSHEKAEDPIALGMKWFTKWQSWITLIILGSLAFLNTWDFPIYVGLFVVIAIYKRIQFAGWAWKRLWEFLSLGLVLGIGGVVLFLPFYLGFQSQAGGLLPSMEYITRGINFWVMFGIFLSLILIWLIRQRFSGELEFSWKKGLQVVIIGILGLFLLSLFYGSALLNLFNIGSSLAESANPLIAGIGEKMVLGGQAFIGLHENNPTAIVLQQAIFRRVTSPGTWLTLGGILILTLGFLIKVPSKAIETQSTEGDLQESGKLNIKVFVLILIIFGAVLTIIPEFFYLRDQFGSRMNTIFKFYFQAWILWSMAVAFITVELFSVLKRWRYLAFSIFWTIMILAGLAYPVLMILNKTNNFTPAVWTLDGNEFISRYTPDEYAAMEWLSTRDTGIIAEAVGGSYTDFARVSTRTGFPTVLGWPGHESQWRGGATEMGSRAQDIQLLYQTDNEDEARFIINKYNIHYIYLGNLERFQYNVAQSKFDANLDNAYSNSSVIIYEVPPDFGD
jgi:YYY domain-containing protein